MRHTEPRTVRRLIAPSEMLIRAGNLTRQRLFAASMPFLFPLGAVLLWLVSLSAINPRLMNDYGLISVLPPVFFVAIALLTCGFCLSLHNRSLSGRVLLVHVVVLVIILYGTPALVEQAPRVAVTWRHLGLTDFILQHGKVLTRFSAYFNWPGFFAMSAFITSIAGVPSLVNLVAWANVFFNLLYLAPLGMIYRSVTRDGRVVWLGIWLFYLANWVGQDYFSPQGFDYFPYLVVIAVALYWFRGSIPRHFSFVVAFERVRQRFPRAAALVEGRRSDQGSAPSTPWQRVGLMAAAILVVAASVPSHQLTPVVALMCIAALAIMNRITPRYLPIIMAVMVLSWASYMGASYFAGHSSHLISTVGAVDKNVQRGVVSRLRGSPGHNFVVHARLVMVAVVVLLALAGGARRILAGHRDVSIAVVALAPTPLLLAQYGGEMFLRVFFYTLPGLAFFAATFFFPSPDSQAAKHRESASIADGERRIWSIPGRKIAWMGQSARRSIGSAAFTTISVGLASLALAGGFLLTRYGNERMDFFTAQEVQAARYLYSVAPKGSLLMAPGISVPWQFEDFAADKTQWISNRAVRTDDVASLEHTMSKYPNGGYLFVTRSAEATVELYGGLSPHALPLFEHSIIESGRFTLIYQNRDARIYMYESPHRVRGKK